MFLVLPCVEQTANLVYPPVTYIALDPAFLVYFIILLLFQIDLGYRQIYKFNRRLLVEFIVTLVAPKVLVVAPDIEVAVAADALAGTVEPVAEKDGWFEKSFFRTHTRRTPFRPVDVLGLLRPTALAASCGRPRTLSSVLSPYRTRQYPFRCIVIALSKVRFTSA